MVILGSPHCRCFTCGLGLKSFFRKITIKQTIYENHVRSTFRLFSFGFLFRDCTTYKESVALISEWIENMDTSSL